MAADPTRLILPIALCNPNAPVKDKNLTTNHIDALADASCSSSKPSSLLSWGLDTPERELTVSRCGVAMGCMDGSSSARAQ